MMAGKKLLKIAIVFILIVALMQIVQPARADNAPDHVAASASITMINSTARPELDGSALAAAHRYSVPFDHAVKISSIITTEDGRYYVVEYQNYLPLAGGIEVLSENGSKVANSTQAGDILRAVAWSESIRALDDTDIASLEIILNNTRNIRTTVTPLANLSNTLIDTYDLKRSLNRYGITNEYAIGLVTGSVNSTNAGYEGAIILVNNLNNQLNDFSNATVDVNDKLPGIIAGSGEIKNGTSYADRELQADIVSTAAGLGVMQEKIGTVQSALSQMSGVGDFLASVQQMATGLLTYVPIIGGSLKDFANYLLSITGDYLTNVFNLKAYAKALQDNIQLEQQKLNAVIGQANQKTADLTGNWSARQTAYVKVWLYAIGLVLLLIALPLALLAYLYRGKISSVLRSGQTKSKK